MQKLVIAILCVIAMAAGYQDRTSEFKDVPAVFEQGAHR